MVVARSSYRRGPLAMATPAPTAPVATAAAAAGSAPHQPKADVSPVPATGARASKQPTAESQPSARSARLGIRPAIPRLAVDNTPRATTETAARTIPAGAGRDGAGLASRRAL